MRPLLKAGIGKTEMVEMIDPAFMKACLVNK